MDKFIFCLSQIRLIHLTDYSLEERLMYKPIVYANAIQSMSILLNAVEKLSNILTWKYPILREVKVGRKWNKLHSS